MFETLNYGNCQFFIVLRKGFMSKLDLHAILRYIYTIIDSFNTYILRVMGLKVQYDYINSAVAADYKYIDHVRAFFLCILGIQKIKHEKQQQKS